MGDELDMMGPVDYLVVEFPDARVPGTCCNESSIWSTGGSELKSQGVLAEAEFQQQKSRILNA